MSRKLQQKQERRLAEQRRREAQRRAARRGNLTTLGIAAGVVVAVVALIAFDRGQAEAPVGGSVSGAGCTAVKTYPSEGRGHVTPGTTVDYDTRPPTSGPHYPTPADPLFYSAPVPEPTLVHNLEHGQIVIWYRPDAPRDLKDSIAKLVAQQPLATVAAPYDRLPSPYRLALTAWGASQMCGGVSQQVVDDFRTRFQGNGPQNVGVPRFSPSS